MRLIDANALSKSVLEWLPSDPCGREELEHPFETDICVSMLQEIEEAPTIDAVPVVRCRDCIHYKLFEFANHDGVPRRKEWFCNSSCCIGGQGIKKPTDYCSYGERKEE